MTNPYLFAAYCILTLAFFIALAVVAKRKSRMLKQIYITGVTVLSLLTGFVLVTTTANAYSSHPSNYMECEDAVGRSQGEGILNPWWHQSDKGLPPYSMLGDERDHFNNCMENSYPANAGEQKTNYIIVSALPFFLPLLFLIYLGVRRKILNKTSPTMSRAVFTRSPHDVND